LILIGSDVNMKIEFSPIGYIYTQVEEVPRHWSVSDAEGSIVVNKRYEAGLKDIGVGQEIVVIFYFDRSPEFTNSHLIQTPPHKSESFGVFSICSPKRPNPIGLSVLEVMGVRENVVHVKRVDMLDQTPVLDIKPWIEKKEK